MRVSLKDLLEKLGIDHELSPYETQPWFHYDEDKGISCSAEVRMGPDGRDIEAEIQFLYDEEQEEDVEEDDGEGGTRIVGKRNFMHMQIMLMRAAPVTEHDEWSPKQLFVKQKDFTGTMYNWEEKGCDFFRSCISSILMSELPEIEDLIAKELSDDDGMGGGRTGRIGRKSPKIRPEKILNMKKGM